MEWMQSEKPCNDRTFGKTPGQAPKRRQKQYTVEHMQEDAGQMVSAGVSAEKGNVQHVRHPGQGMPIAEMDGGQCPPNVVRRKPFQHSRIFIDVIGVVEIDEIESDGLAIDASDQRHQEKTDPKKFLALYQRLPGSSRHIEPFLERCQPVSAGIMVTSASFIAANTIS